ncbi:MAG: ACT domain-containing protein [Phycisphaeraceae bacterium]|nr:ACT domain-containing protein [Phycisphaeraceae bacterium]
MTPPLTIREVPGRFAIVRFTPGAPVPAWAASSTAAVHSITRTAGECSVIVEDSAVPGDLPAGSRAERPFVAFVVDGPLDFALVGILSRLAGALARAEIPVFALSTFDTDWLFVRADYRAAALRALGGVAAVVAASVPPAS